MFESINSTVTVTVTVHYTTAEKLQDRHAQKLYDDATFHF